MNKKKSPFSNRVLMMGMILENDLSKLYSIEDISKLQNLSPLKKTVPLLVQLLGNNNPVVSCQTLESNTTNLSQLLTTYKDEVLGGGSPKE